MVRNINLKKMRTDLFQDDRKGVNSAGHYNLTAVQASKQSNRQHNTNDSLPTFTSANIGSELSTILKPKPSTTSHILD